MIARPCIVEGRIADCGALPEGLYVYQNMRTAGHRALDVERHLELLDRAAREVLGIPVETNMLIVGQLVKKLLAGNGYPADRLSYVTLRLYGSGKLVIIAREIYPYDRLSLRTIYPRGVAVDYDIPFSSQPSSLAIAVTEAARVRASQQLAAAVANGELPPSAAIGKPVVLHRNYDGEILSADGAPLFVLADERLITPAATPFTVEFAAAEQAITAAGMSLAFERIDEEVLADADEVFFVDHRGVTALSCVDHRPYMHIIAERIGKNLK